MNEAEALEVTATEPTPPETPVTTEHDQSVLFDPAQHHEEIAQAAYALWEERGCTGGSHEDDWFRAEEEVRRRHASGVCHPQ